MAARRIRVSFRAAKQWLHCRESDRNEKRTSRRDRPKSTGGSDKNDSRSLCPRRSSQTNNNVFVSVRFKGRGRPSVGGRPNSGSLSLVDTDRVHRRSLSLTLTHSLIHSRSGKRERSVALRIIKYVDLRFLPLDRILENASTQLRHRSWAM